MFRALIGQIVIDRHGRFLNRSEPARRAKSSALICACRLTAISFTVLTTPSRITKRPSIMTAETSCPSAEYTIAETG